MDRKALPIEKTRALLNKLSLDALLLRSTDAYFNEYVPEHESARAYITGFNGSVGDAIITTNEAHLFVDGRYELQAQSQAKNFKVHVSSGIERSWLSFVALPANKGISLAFDPNTISLNLYDKLVSQCQSNGISLTAQAPQILEEILKERVSAPARPKELRQVPIEESGESTNSKRRRLEQDLERLEIDAFLSVKLDDIAWLSNLRGNYFPFQSTFPSLAIAWPERLALGLLPGFSLPKEVLSTDIEVRPLAELLPHVAKSFVVLGIDENETSKAHVMALQDLGIKLKRVTNPIAPLKAIKNDEELLLMHRSFKKADEVVHKTESYVIKSYEKGEPLSEGEISDYLKGQFFSSGATELSFRPICAGGANGAIIHYGTPSSEEKVAEGSLFLLDTGAYYEGGYATDLTRTFLAAKPNAVAQSFQKEMFTLVLKASIAGLSARFKRGVLGMQLDAVVRAPLNRAGLDYAHGTGHGIGINVHEFPPRIGPNSTTELKERQVFSIEPGVYIEGLGGVRIENLATIVADPDNPSFLSVLPLTFCPLDHRLIEQGMLDNYEQEFLRYFQAEWQSDAPMPKLPPYRRASFIG